MSPGEWATLLGFAVTFATAVFALVRGLRADKTAEKKVTTEERQAEFGANLELNKYIDGRVDRMVEDRIRDVRDELAQVKSQERIRTNAITRILRTIAVQWPIGQPGPFLDPADIAAVEETIPAQWIRRNGEPKRI